MERAEITARNAARRINNFEEVALGFTKRVSGEEARRCPQCADPVCMAGCPLRINIPGFIRHLREGNVTQAYAVIKEENFLPAICGRICSAPCEVACILNDEGSPIGIRALERFAADHGKGRADKRQEIFRKGKKVAVIGSGPAGLSAAYFLARKGYSITIFESLDKPGGVLRYGIPEFRIPKKVLDAEIHDIMKLGVEIKTNIFIGRTLTLEELQAQGYAAILIATGAGVPKFMDLKGDNLGGVYYGEEFLMRINWDKKAMSNSSGPNFILGDRVAVIGSGNTAMDCARAARRFNREIHLIFRRTEEEMRVRGEDRNFAIEEGIKLEPLVKPLEILADQNNFVSGLKCIRMDYAEGSKEGEWELKPVPDSEFIMDVNSVVIAIGHNPNSSLGDKGSYKLKRRGDGSIWTEDNTGMTSVEGIFAAGNVASNAGPVVEALASGKKSADTIDKYLTA